MISHLCHFVGLSTGPGSASRHAAAAARQAPRRRLIGVRGQRQHAPHARRSQYSASGAVALAQGARFARSNERAGFCMRSRRTFVCFVLTHSCYLCVCLVLSSSCSPRKFTRSSRPYSSAFGTWCDAIFSTRLPHPRPQTSRRTCNILTNQGWALKRVVET